MKKILSKFERNENSRLENPPNSSSSSSSNEKNSFVGKVFTVGRVTVTVEDVLAEGTHILHIPLSIYLCPQFPYLPTRSNAIMFITGLIYRWAVTYMPHSFLPPSD